MNKRREGTHSVVDARADDETLLTAVHAMVDGDNITRLLKTRTNENEKRHGEQDTLARMRGN